ncbi:hypothetical protein I6G82_20510 [Lysinibacillus macroides]|uniref:PDZ domain-containing protein n=1 Tax=Lysinibacillus macroides TaxID=33935 RepID=A0A0M9DHH0_9BACI|nr:PDZ domain-containing protein [Lysinibacillus macroides]KOY80252.1 hypothetical protein ADM90_20590 [Lysinibacillus macroides]QPR67557.1 hypothetical protein I6G82_20510 [Lysinibacillus macroides]
MGIKLEEKNGQWLINEPYFKEWANKQNLSVGDIILEIDGHNINELNNNIKYYPVIRAARELTFVNKEDGQLSHLQIAPFDVFQQFIYIFLLPACYFLLSLIVSFYLNQFHKSIFSRA